MSNNENIGRNSSGGIHPGMGRSTAEDPGKYIDISELSAEKRYILTLSDSRVRKLIRIARKTVARKTACSAPEGSAVSVIETAYKLPDNAQKRLDFLRKTGVSARDAGEKKWFTYTQKLEGMSFTKPRMRKGDTDVKIYRRLVNECRRKHLPEDFASSMVASIMEYIRTGHMKPIILVGPAGSGKTTGGKLFAEILGLKHFLISSSRADHSHGIFGEGSSFQSPDVGELAKGIIETGSLNLVFIIDEIEKAPVNHNRTSVADELLSVCDDSGSEFRDNFLEFSLPIDRSPIIMTCNELAPIPAPLRDRCEIYRFYDVELPRMRDIIREYAGKQVSLNYPDTLTVDGEVLDSAVEKLYDEGVRSIRQYCSLVDGALRTAYCRLLEADSPRPMAVTGDIFDERIGHLTESCGSGLGF